MWLVVWIQCGGRGGGGVLGVPVRVLGFRVWGL